MSNVKDNQVEMGTPSLSSSSSTQAPQIPSSSSSSLEFSEVSTSNSSSIIRMSRPPKILHPTLAFHEQRWKVTEKSSSNVLLPGFQCPSFYNTQAVMEDGVTMMSFSNNDFEKNYVVLFFFPMDRSVDYSELMAFKENLENFAKNDCQVVGVTSDSLSTIENWIKLEPMQGGTGGPVNFPIISDKTMDVAKVFGVKRPSGMPARATFILDKNRIVRHTSVYPRVVGRSVDEVLRTLQAIKEIDQRGGEENEVCTPPGWKEGEDLIEDTPQGKKEYYSKMVPKKEASRSHVEECKSITKSTGIEVVCPITQWFYKIPN